MLHLINILCKSKNLNGKIEFENVLKSSTSTNDINSLLKDLFLFRHEKTGDCFTHYVSRTGNLNLIRLLQENYLHILPENYFEFSNNDGKTALHEVIYCYYLFFFISQISFIFKKACQNCHYDVVVYLIENLKVSVNKLRKGDW